MMAEWPMVSILPNSKQALINIPARLIAATAIVHDLILVTRNVKDFEDIVVSVINPGSSE